MITLDTINQKNFTKLCEKWGRKQMTQRAELQALIMFGLLHYSKVADTCYLSKVMQVVSSVRSVPAKTIQKYIMAHANVYLVKEKGTGVPIFKKRKGEKDQLVTVPDVEWWNHEVNHENKVNFNLAKYEAIVAKKIVDNSVDINEFIKDLRAKVAELTPKSEEKTGKVEAVA